MTNDRGQGPGRAQQSTNLVQAPRSLLLWGQLRWIHLPGDFSNGGDGFATKFFISSHNLEKKSGEGCSPSDTPPDGGEFATYEVEFHHFLTGEFASCAPKSQCSCRFPRASSFPESNLNSRATASSSTQEEFLLRCNSYLANTFHLINTFHLVID